MKFRSLVLLLSCIVALAYSGLSFLYTREVLSSLIILGITFIIAFLVFYYIMERFVYSKIKLIYKLIHHLKLGKDLKEALGEHVSDDPINDVQLEVKQWALDKTAEIESLKSQEKYRREFLSNISHEFKTPLFSAQGYLDALQDGLIDEDPELARSFLNKAVNNLERLGFLIKDLDVISKLERGEVPMQFSRFDIADLIAEIIDALELKAAKHEIRLVFKEKYRLHMHVYADREKIAQVLMNLIGNSIKYGKRNGTTDIRIFELHNQALIEITDDGEGIEENNLPRIFERFFRTEQSRSRQIGGSGLGLSIVKHILEAHQQTITVRSTVGMGTTFAFTLKRK